MVLDENTFRWIKALSFTDLFTIALWSILLVRAQLYGEDLSYNDVRRNSLSELDRTLSIQVTRRGFTSTAPGPAAARRERSRSPFTSSDSDESSR